MPLKVSRLHELHPRRFFLDTWKKIDDEAAHSREERARAGKGYDWRPLIVLSAGAVFLTLMEYFGSSGFMRRLLDTHELIGPFAGLEELIVSSPFSGLYDFIWWSGWRVLGYFILPCITLWMIRERPFEYGLRTHGFREHAWIYLLCYCVVLVFVVLVSFTDEFSTYYPFYKLAHRSWFDFIAWELLYAAQFFSLEFFFRGYWLGGCKTAMGSHAIFAMVVPYCMIHYGKPWLEAMAAIAAGIVLGTLAMKTRSIWSGFLIHVSVAVSMDTAALLQTTGLPKVWWPET